MRLSAQVCHAHSCKKESQHLGKPWTRFGCAHHCAIHAMYIFVHFARSARASAKGIMLITSPYQCNSLRGGGGNFAPGIFRTRKFRAGFISHSGLKIEREISHLPGLFTVQATVPRGPSLVKKTHHQGFA